jgi:hypothetical protein
MSTAMRARTLHGCRGLLALALLAGCAATEPEAKPAQSPPSQRAGLNLAGLPSDIVPGPSPAAQSATTSFAPGGACSGEVQPQLAQVLSNRATQSRRCYERLLRSKPSAEGKYVVSLRLSKRGKVEHARLVKDEVGDAEMASCVLSRFRSASYPAPRGGCADINVPLNYEPQRTASNGARL